MPQRLADRLVAARRRRFVGREAERSLFQSALAADELPFAILYVYGPGGVGKTTLVREFAYLCGQAGVPALYVDARDVEASPDAFANALRLAMDLPPTQAPLDALAEATGRRVILIDTYEAIGPLDGWLRERFLPQLPEDVLVVMAGQKAPSAAWRADPGWQSLLYVLPLRNLSPGESCVYLEQRGVPCEEHDEVLHFTHGHPLALSLVADLFAQRVDIRFQPEVAPDVIKTLLEQFVQKVPGPAHRAALEACALVRLTTEDLLAEMVSTPDARELFEWLRSLSFIDSGPLGIYPHDLAREALVADLRWRHPSWYAELHNRARNYYARRLQKTAGPEQQQTMLDYIFLHRDNPVVRPFLEWQESGTALAEPARPGDRAALLETVARHEGRESARLAACWLDRQPQGVVTFKNAGGDILGFLGMVSLAVAPPGDVLADPATARAWRYLEQNASLRSGEKATYFRFWMASDSYQGVSGTQSLIFVTVVLHYLTTPGLAFTFFPCADPDFWTPILSYADIKRIPELDFEVGGRRYGVFGHDWRTVPPMAWLTLLADKEVQVAPVSQQPLRSVEPVVVLSEPEFASAVHDALRDMARPDALVGNPLLHSRLLLEVSGANASPIERAAALQGLLKEASGSLHASPRDEKLYRALYHTYIQPAPTQERAAEILDLPFSTYRRHLKAGVDQVTEFLWRRELAGMAK